jgi:hypothetical protein
MSDPIDRARLPFTWCRGVQGSELVTLQTVGAFEARMRMVCRHPEHAPKCDTCDGIERVQEAVGAAGAAMVYAQR